MTLLLLALLAAEPGHAAEVRAAEERCDLPALHQERARLEDELGRALREPARAAEITWELEEVDRALAWCGVRAT